MWQTCSCCGSGDEVTVVELDGKGARVALSGLMRTFEQLYTRGLKPSDPIGDELLAMIKVLNYVPRSAEEMYRAALLREYATFCTRKEQEND
jgi:hypothetical protein